MTVNAKLVHKNNYLQKSNYYFVKLYTHTHTHTTELWPFFWDHPVEPVPEENFLTLWCKGRLIEADRLTIRLGATPSGLTSAHVHHPPVFFTGRMPFLPPNQQCQRTEGLAESKVVLKIVKILFK